MPEPQLPPSPRDADEPLDRRSEILRVELERRIELIESADDAEFGDFGALDWTVCTVVFLALPLLIVWWFV